ncbi:MAG: trypsin-like peptidase domain-containing protein [Moorea sp. SIO4E2]|uniref:trypsin-like peptidase domain-containing protein n=1 Tax=Moorena sp. SIO4E2 TaxID=2607826 RepID=UPI0013B5D143|nr:trypsin-like peptidase domain-containing protein [Moorena sp. SIO4E2]NEQ11561.1 trypsin-like peptidase domain-containing protein [Moorena sp. SIO4E2]
MTPEELQESVVLITSRDPKINRFGTGFVMRQVSGTAFLLTCAHVVKDVGGPENVKADGIPGTVIASGEDDGLDLAVLRVDGLWNKPELHRQEGFAEKGNSFLTAGFQLFAKDHLIRPLHGTLGQQVRLQLKQAWERIQAWDLRIVDDYGLQPGYSGSPVVDEASGELLGVVSHRQGEGKTGLAISIGALDRIWRVLDGDQLYKVLVKLGYEDQERLFFRLIRKQSVAAFLIHGYPEYGQRWLLNRLVEKHLPNSITGKVIKVNLARKVRRTDIKTLWRELGNQVGLWGKGASVTAITERVYRYWQTQNVLLVFHDVNVMSEAYLDQLIREFWTPLATNARQVNPSASRFKLLMFLVDYEGNVGNLDAIFSDKIDRTQPHMPVKSAKINQFDEDELIDWMMRESEELPIEFTHEVDETVKVVLENSDNGIPEYVLAEICDRCGVDWFNDVKQRWRL